MNATSSDKEENIIEVDEKKLLEGLNQSLICLLNNDTIDQAYEMGLTTIAKVTQSKGAFLFHYQPGPGRKAKLICQFGLTLEKNIPTIISRSNQNHCLEVLNTEDWVKVLNQNQLSVSSFASLGPTFQFLFPGKEEGVLYHFPIFLDKKLWGMLSLARKKMEGDWLPHKSHLLEPFSDSLGNYIARKKAEETIQENQQKYLNFILHSTDGIYYMNCGVPISTDLPEETQVKMYYKNAYVEEANKALANMYGFASASEMIGQNPEQLQKPEDYEYNKISFIKFIQNGYRINNVQTKELNIRGGTRYFLNQAVGDFDDKNNLIGIWGTQQDVTEKIEAKSTLETNQQQLDLIIQGAHLGSWDWNIQTGELLINDRWANMLDFEKAELEPIKWETFFGLIHPEDIQIVWDHFERHLKKESAFFELEFRMRTKSGDWRWIYDRGQIVVRDAEGIPIRAMGTHMDITDKKQIEMALVQSEALQKAMLNALPDIKFRINKQGVYLGFYSNTRSNRDLFNSPDKFLGKKLHEVLPLEVAEPLMEKLLQAIYTKEVQNLEYELEIKGETQFFEARLNAISEEEVIIVSRNMTEQLATQRELANKIKELDEKNRQLMKYIDSNLELENFAYVASHDLQEPVRTMRNFAQVLHKKHSDSLNQTGKDYLNFIIDGAENMHQLIQDLLTYSRANTEEHHVELIRLDFLIEQIRKSFHNTISEKQARIHIEHLPRSIVGNRTKLTQVFQNLIANAIKFNKPGHNPEVTIQGMELEDYWQFEIQDNGIGINENYFNKIFHLFKKLHSRREYQGTGIGLALCKKIVEQHAGQIWVESTPGAGSTFFFTIRKGLSTIKRGNINA